MHVKSYYGIRYIGRPCIETLITGYPSVKDVSFPRVTIQSPIAQQGSLTAQQPLELLCIDFTKADIAKGGKENILVLTDTFSKYSQAIMSLIIKKPLWLPKYWWKSGFLVFGIPARIHSDQGRSFDNEIIGHLCKMYGIKQTTTDTIQSKRQLIM